MIKPETIITDTHTKSTFHSSYKGKYAIMDNLEERSEPLVHAQNERFNMDYFYTIAVHRGTMHLTIAGMPVDVRSNEFIVIMPCLSMKIDESRCIYSILLTSSHLMNDIFEHTTLGKDVGIRALKYSHFHMKQEEAMELLECYLRLKDEHKTEEYPMKEVVLRSYLTAGIAKFMSRKNTYERIEHSTNSKQYAFFKQFTELLGRDYRRERSVKYYADKLQITPKYLSNITLTYTRMPASQVIDQYLIHAIKQVLYAHENNIKTLSKDFNFPSQSFFGRFFRRLTGMSPNTYIKNNNKHALSF